MLFSFPKYTGPRMCVAISLTSVSWCEGAAGTGVVVAKEKGERGRKLETLSSGI